MFLKQFFYSVIMTAIVVTLVVVTRLPTDLRSDRRFGHSSDVSHNVDVVLNIVHYIIFGDHKISFIHFISLLSVLKNQKPNVIYIHCDCLLLYGDYWPRVVRLSERTNTSVIVRYIDRPIEIFGQKLTKKWIDWRVI